MLRCLADRPPNRSLDQGLQLPAFLVDLGEHEALKLILNSFNLEDARHTRGQLVSIAEKLVAGKSNAVQYQQRTGIATHKHPGDEGRVRAHRTGS